MHMDIVCTCVQVTCTMVTVTYPAVYDCRSCWYAVCFWAQRLSLVANDDTVSYRYVQLQHV
jgi:hypothetical protein